MKVFFRAIFFLFAVSVTISTHGAEIFGSYANGCIRGAQPLGKSSLYQTLIYGKGRNYGHPDLISYIEDLALRLNKAKLPGLLVGDLSLRYGGPFGRGSAHGSHNTGLDVDIPFDSSTPRKTVSELRNPRDIYIVDRKQRPTKNFTQNHLKLIYFAANDDRVERIFIAPGIKREICNLYKGADRNWLGKLRPWFGHRAHMHVRLKCPVNSKDCIPQAKVPKGDGCGAELMSWFEPPKRQTGTTTVVKKKVKKELPSQCLTVLKGD